MSRSTLLPLLLLLVLNSVFAEKYRDIPSSGRKIDPISLGDTLPHYPLTDTHYQSVELYSYLKEQPIILIYYRGGW